MTKQIELSKQGKNKGKFVALVDDEDFENLSKHRWSVARVYIGAAREMLYAVRVENRKTIYMHQEIISRNDGMVIDHADGNGLNNTRSNIRACTRSQNSFNQIPRGVNRYKGVHERNGKYSASIGLNGKTIFLGTFNTDRQAAIAYNEAAVKYHGEFANLNKV